MQSRRQHCVSYNRSYADNNQTPTMCAIWLLPLSFSLKRGGDMAATGAPGCYVRQSSYTCILLITFLIVCKYVCLIF